MNSSRYGGGGREKGAGTCACVIIHVRGSGKGLFMMSVIDILSGSHGDLT